jgi:ribosome maturation factor RimP
MQDLKDEIQEQLFALDPELVLVALERPGTDALRIFIDHPGGVDLEVCERVSKNLGALRARYSLEVSSPGPKYRLASHVPETKEQLK